MSETQHTYTPVYPSVAIESHDLTPWVLCGGVMVTCGDLDLCSSCGSRRVRSQAATRTIDVEYIDGGRREPLPYPLDEDKERAKAAAASRDASLTAFVDDLLDLLQDVGGMSAAWCADRLAQYETLLREG
jgi:hypothetical protein